MNTVCCFHSSQPHTAPHAVLPFISTLDSPRLSLIHRSPYRTVEVRWSDRKWKMNLSHQEQSELLLQGGFQPAPLLTGLMNLHFSSTPDVNLGVLTKCTTAPCSRGIWDISLMRDMTFQPQLQPGSTQQAADVTRPSALWTKSRESSGGGSTPIFHSWMLTPPCHNTTFILLNSTRIPALRLYLNICKHVPTKTCIHESKVEVLKVLMSFVTVVMSGCGLSEH